MHPITARLWRGCTFLPLGWTCCPWDHLDCFSLQPRSISSNHTNIFQGVPSKPQKKTLNRHPLAIYLTPFGSSRYKHWKKSRNNLSISWFVISTTMGAMFASPNSIKFMCIHRIWSWFKVGQVTSILVVPLTLACRNNVWRRGNPRKLWQQSQIYKMCVSKTLLDSKLILLHGKKTNTPPTCHHHRFTPSCHSCSEIASGNIHLSGNGIIQLGTCKARQFEIHLATVGGLDSDWIPLIERDFCIGVP